MKIKTTKKSMKDSYDQIVKIGYCNAQFLLKFENETAYSTRAEGWACDYYDVNGVLISTGYAPLESKNTYCNYDLVKKYDDQAREIICNYSHNWEQQQEQVKALLNEFIAEVTK